MVEDGLGIRIVSPEEIRRRSFGEVTKPETMNWASVFGEKAAIEIHDNRLVVRNIKYNPAFNNVSLNVENGLFCEKIFGPTNDLKCACGKYAGEKHKGTICSNCLVEVTLSRVTRKRFGHITLVSPVVHPWLKDVISVLLDSPIDDLADAGARTIEKLLRNMDIDARHAELRNQLQSGLVDKRQATTKKCLSFLSGIEASCNLPDLMILHTIPVLPSGLRLAIPISGNKYTPSDLNELYARVIDRNNQLRQVIQSKAPDGILRQERRMLQEAVDELFGSEGSTRVSNASSIKPLTSLSDLLVSRVTEFREKLTKPGAVIKYFSNGRFLSRIYSKLREVDSQFKQNILKSVDELELSVRASNCLRNANITTVAELVQTSEYNMLKSKNFGRKSLNEIKELLDGMGLHLGMRLDEPTISGLSGMILRKSEIQIELDDCREEEQSDILVNELTCLLFALCLDSSLAKSETGKTFENIEEIFEIFIPHILRRFETYHICKTWNEKAENLFQRTQYEEAVSCCDTILNLDPASTDALYLKGLCLSSLTHHLEAINCYDRILRLDKDNVYACFSKGLAYIHLGAEEEALRCYDEAIAIDSEFVPALIERGNTLLGCGRAEEAINSYDIVLSLEPKHLKALINKGRAFDKLGRYKEALSCYDHALVIDSNNADVWFNKGLTLERKSREETRPPMTPEEKLLSAIFGEGEYVSFEEILECYENVLRSDPHFTEAMFRKSVTLHSMGKDVLALRCFEEALAIDAGDYRVWYAQAVVQDRLFRKNKACISFKKFLGLAPDNMSMESRIEYALKRVDEIEKGEQ